MLFWVVGPGKNDQIIKFALLQVVLLCFSSWLCFPTFSNSHIHLNGSLCILEKLVFSEMEPIPYSLTTLALISGAEDSNTALSSISISAVSVIPADFLKE